MTSQSLMAHEKIDIIASEIKREKWKRLLPDIKCIQSKKTM